MPYIQCLSFTARPPRPYLLPKCLPRLRLHLLSEAPTKTPSTTTCVDSPLKMKVKSKERSCAWVRKKQTRRCAKPGVSSHCPRMFGVGCSEDSKKRFIHPDGKAKRCAWVAQNKTQNRCSIAGIAITCIATCAPYN